MIRTSGDAPLPLSAIRWCTPNRCCSSMTASERSANAIPSWLSPWVPTPRSQSPPAMPSRSGPRSLPVAAGVRSAYVTRGSSSASEPGSNSEPWAGSELAPNACSRNRTAPHPPRSASTCRKCCPASTSVGAMIAAWCPDPIATSAACTATSVLPEPTSPWSRTFIGRGRAIAASICSVARRCAAVGSNGSVRSRRSSSGPPGSCATPALCALPPMLSERQPQLEDEQLVELQPFDRGGELGLRAREVDVPDRTVERRQRLRADQVLGHRIGDRTESSERAPHELADRARRDALGCSVDRRDPPRVHQVLVVALEQLDLLVRELEPPSVELRDPRDRDLVPLLVHRTHPGLVKERQVEVARAVVQRDRDH